MLFCCPWRDVEISWHKHFVIVSRRQQTPQLTNSDKCHNLPRSGGTVLITPGGRSVDSTRWSQILAQNRDVCLPHLHSTISTPPLGGFPSEYCHDVWYEKKLEWWNGDYERNLKTCLFVSTESTNVTGRQTNTQTDTAWRHRLRLCIASRGKKDRQQSIVTVFTTVMS